VIETVLDDNEKLGIDWNLKITAAGAKRPVTFPFEEFKAASGRIETAVSLPAGGNRRGRKLLLDSRSRSSNNSGLIPNR